MIKRGLLLFFMMVLSILAFGLEGKRMKPDTNTIDSGIFENAKEKIGYVSNMGFTHKRFPCYANFKVMKLYKPAWFNGSTFLKDANFDSTKFKYFVDFTDVTFKKDASFSACVFDKFLFMSHVGTDSVTDFNFYNAELPLVIDFSNNKNLHTMVDFRDANFDTISRNRKNCPDNRVFINLYNAMTSKVRLDYIHFRLCFYDPGQGDKDIDGLLRLLRPKRSILSEAEIIGITQKLLSSARYREYIDVIFPATSIRDTTVKEFTEFYVGRNMFFPKRLSNDEIDGLYLCLLKNFETSGQEDSYDELYAAYQDHQWAGRGWLSFLHVLPKYWNWYGRNTEWIIGWTISLLTLFTLINFSFYPVLFGHPKQEDNAYFIEAVPMLSAHDRFRNFKKLKYAFIYTSVIFFSFSIKLEKLNYKRKAFFYIALISVVGLLCLGYLANFVLQK